MSEPMTNAEVEAAWHFMKLCDEQVTFELPLRQYREPLVQAAFDRAIAEGWFALVDIKARDIGLGHEAYARVFRLTEYGCAVSNGLRRRVKGTDIEPDGRKSA